jgi:hypothetical protein
LKTMIESYAIDPQIRMLIWTSAAARGAALL